MLLSLNIWLFNARADGTIDELYRYWILGQVKTAHPSSATCSTGSTDPDAPAANGRGSDCSRS
jgi:hypothetical protein